MALATSGIATSASAIDRVWDGGAGTESWHDATNWLPDGVPTAEDDVVIAGTGNVVRYTDGDAEIQSLAVSSSAQLIIEGGSLTVSAAATTSGASLRFNGGQLLANMDVIDATINVDNGATVATDIRVLGDVNYFGRITAGQHLTVDSTLEYPGSTLSFFGGQNHGTLRLQTSSGDDSASVVLSPGFSFVNHPGARLEIAGGEQHISGTALWFLTNRGDVFVEENASLSFPGGIVTVIQENGSMDGDPGSTINDCRFFVTGGQLNGDLRFINASVGASAAIPEPIVIRLAGVCCLQFSDSPLATFRLVGDAEFHENVIDIASDITNHGHIELIDASAKAPVRLDIDFGFTLQNASDGVIEFQQGSGSLTGYRLVNEGTIIVASDTTVDGNLQIFSQEDGVCDINGEVELTSLHMFIQGGLMDATGGSFKAYERVDYFGGALLGNVVAREAVLAVSESVAELSTLFVEGYVTLERWDSPAVTLQVRSHGERDGRLIVLNFVNHGTLVLDDQSDQAEASILSTGGLVVNGEDGVIIARSIPNQSFGTYIAGGFQNFGVVEVESDAGLNITTPVFHDGGELRTQEGGNLRIRGTSPFLYTAGSLNGYVTAENVPINIAATVTTPSTLFVTGSSAALEAFDAPAVTIDLSRGALFVGAVVSHGPYQVVRGPNSGGADFMMEEGEQFVLAETSGIFVSSGIPGSQPAIFGPVLNHGTIDPGFPDSLVVHGAFEQSASGTLQTTFSGVDDDEYGRLEVVDGPAVMDGTLRVSIDDGFKPPVGTIRTIIEGDFVAGSFDVIESDTPIEVIRTATKFNVEFLEDPINADLNGDDVVDVNDLLIVLAEWGPCDGDPCTADLNGDGTVNVDDLCLLLALWR